MLVGEREDVSIKPGFVSHKLVRCSAHLHLIVRDDLVAARITPDEALLRPLSGEEAWAFLKLDLVRIKLRTGFSRNLLPRTCYLHMIKTPLFVSIILLFFTRRYLVTPTLSNFYCLLALSARELAQTQNHFQERTCEFDPARHDSEI